MGQTLTHGVYLPSEGERNCYSGLASNWRLLNGAIGTVAAHTTAIAEKAPLVHTHTKSDVTDLLNSNFIPSSDMNYTLGSSDLRWKQIWAGGYKTKFNSIDFTDSTTTGSIQSWWVDTSEKNGTGFFGVGSIRSHSLGLNEEHFRIKNAGGKWADLYIQLGDNNQFTIGTAASSDVTNNGFKGKFTPLASFIPNANNSYDLGSSSYQWNNLYAKKTYTDTVKAGTGILTLQSNGTNNSIAIYNGTRAADGGGIWLYGKDSAPGALVKLQIYNTTTSKYEGIVLNSVNFYPDKNNLINLGTSDYKWKTLNGINPGALSLPSSDSADYIDLSSNLSTNAEYQYTAPYDGWLCLYVIVDEFYTENAVGLYRSDTSANSHQWAKSVTAAINLYKQNKYQGSVMLPVESGKKYICYISLNANTTIHNKLLFFYKNKGNV